MKPVKTPFGVKKIEEGENVTYFSQAGGEQNTFVQLSDALQELVYMRPLQHVDRMNFALYVDGHYEIGIIGGLAE